jgi:L-lactate dehydrogenase complex protein LldE
VTRSPASVASLLSRAPTSSSEVQIALFITCIGDTLFPEAGRATVQVLERLGHDVVFPEEQTCCGQMHSNSGYAKEAARLGRRFQKIFGGFEAVVAPSSSCVGTVREAYGMANVFELSELLVHRLGVEDVGASFAGRVAYHPTCHSLRVTRVGDAPFRLLANVRGLELVELPRADECCGFGGTFSIKNADTSSAMLADKCDAIVSTGADVCTAVDSSCLLQIGGGLSRRGAAVRAVHLAEILAAT